MASTMGKVSFLNPSVPLSLPPIDSNRAIAFLYLIVSDLAQVAPIECGKMDVKWFIFYKPNLASELILESLLEPS